MVAVVLALCSASVLGVSDFLAGLAGRREAAIRIVLVSYTVSLLILLTLAPFLDGQLSWPAVAWGLGMGVVEGLAMWWFYQALASGPISVVSLVAAVLGTSVPVAVGFVLGERPGALAGLGVAAGLGAVLLLSSGEPGADAGGARFTGRVAVLAAGAGVAFSGVAICLHHMPADGGLWPLAIARVPAVAIFVLVALTLGELGMPRGAPLRVALLLGVLNVVSLAAAWYAYQTSLLSVTSILVSLYPVVTVLLAFTVLRERISRWQCAGLVLALAAVVLISA